MRVTDGERLILMNQVRMMEALYGEVADVQKPLLNKGITTTQELLSGHHTPLQVADILNTYRRETD